MQREPKGLPRPVELVLAALLGLVTLPLSLAAAIAIRLSSRGPVLHHSIRSGIDGTPFTLYKFRTMKVEADQEGPGITIAKDPRVTTVGRFLRRTKLDELPQVLNVLKGDMSLVGPRPEDPRYVALYSDEQRKVLRVRPGLVGPGTIAYRDEADLMTSMSDADEVYMRDIAPRKLEIDIAYLGTRNAWSDLLTLVRALVATFSRKKPPKSP